MDTQMHLTKEFLIACEDDYTGLWQLVNRTEQNYPALKSSSELKPFILNYILKMLKTTLIAVGRLKNGGFCKWEESPQEIIARIDKEWDGSRYKSDGLYGIWFDITEQGKEELKRLKAME